MSVFQKEGVWELWMRLKPKANPEEHIKKAEQNIRSFFPGAQVRRAGWPQLESLYLYEEESLSLKSPFKPPLFVQNHRDFPHADLVSEIQAEMKILESLSQKKGAKGFLKAQSALSKG